MGTHLGPLKALLAATAGSFLFDLGVSLARGWTPTPDYVALCAALALGAAVLIGLLTAPTRRPEIALALWMGLNIQTATMLYVTPRSAGSKAPLAHNALGPSAKGANK